MDAGFKNAVDTFFLEMEKEYGGKDYSEEKKKAVMQAINDRVNQERLRYRLEEEEEYINDKLADLLGKIIFGPSGSERL